MSDHFSTVSLRQLTAQILNTEKRGTIFGIYKSRFFRPKPNLSMSIFGQTIDTPIGVAAGPHTQMAQNIITAWLCGARYIELKTVQTLDEIKVSKPCIDMQDEGYNCEWSQELKIEESFREYLKAWILIHLLHHKFGRKTPLNTIFNMSVGYDMAGILNDNVQWFFSKMAGCSAEKQAMIDEIRDLYPAVDDIEIPDRISDNITLSTMHGCPPDEIEKIGKYLLEKKQLTQIVTGMTHIMVMALFLFILLPFLHVSDMINDLLYLPLFSISILMTLFFWANAIVRYKFMIIKPEFEDVPIKKGKYALKKRIS